MNRKLLAACVGFILAVIVSATLSIILPGCAKPETFRDTVEVIDASKTNKVEKIGELIWNTTEYETVVIYQNKVYTVDDKDSYYAAKMHLNQPAEAIIEVRGDKVRVKEVLP